MKISRLSGIGLLLLVLSSFNSGNLPKSFTDLLERGKLIFESPEGLVETRIIENSEMNYEYAMKYPDKNFEIRYAIRPLDSMLIDYNEKVKNKQPGQANADPNDLYPSILQAVIFNISGKFAKVSVFDKEAVKREFNADWGATTMVELRKEFGQDYKYCMVVALHKDDIADAYCLYLSDTKEGFEKLLLPVFHSLKFK